MIAIDTNILVRILVDDQDAAHQCMNARALMAEASRVWGSPMVLFLGHPVSVGFQDSPSVPVI